MGQICDSISGLCPFGIMSCIQVDIGCMLTAFLGPHSLLAQPAPHVSLPPSEQCFEFFFKALGLNFHCQLGYWEQPRKRSNIGVYWA